MRKNLLAALMAGLLALGAVACEEGMEEGEEDEMEEEDGMDDDDDM